MMRWCRVIVFAVQRMSVLLVIHRGDTPNMPLNAEHGTGMSAAGHCRQCAITKLVLGQLTLSLKHPDKHAWMVVGVESQQYGECPLRDGQEADGDEVLVSSHRA